MIDSLLLCMSASRVTCSCVVFVSKRFGAMESEPPPEGEVLGPTATESAERSTRSQAVRPGRSVGVLYQRGVDAEG